MNETMSETKEKSAPSQSKAPKRRSGLWRAGRFCLLGFITLVTLYIFFRVEEDWRGKRAWKHYRVTMEAKGAVFELQKLVPPPVPDEQNFAMTPLLKPMLNLYPPGTTNASRWRDEEGKKRVESIQLEDAQLNDKILARPLSDVEAPGLGLAQIPGRQKWDLGERISLSDWQKYYRESQAFPSWPEQRTAAEDVLKALSRYESELAELQEASQRPYARFNVFYGEENPAAVLLPHLHVLRGLARVVQLRAVAEFEAGQVDAAYKDVQLLFVLTDSIRNEPTLISYLVRLAMISITEQTVWEGLVTHRWSEPQLVALQQRFAEMDLVAELKRAMESEQAWGTEIFEWMIRKPEALLEISDPDPSDLGKIGMKLIPSGWICFEAVNYNQLFESYYLQVLPDEADDLDVSQIKRSSALFDKTMMNETAAEAFFGHRTLVKMLMPALRKISPKAIQAEAMKDMTITAIALERFHLANKTYPQSLDELIPQFASELPDDPITHQPLRYECFNSESFRLWSVGWNQVDDGGVVAVRTKERRLLTEHGDWVWPQTNGMEIRVKAE